MKTVLRGLRARLTGADYQRTAGLRKEDLFVHNLLGVEPPDWTNN